MAYSEDIWILLQRMVGKSDIVRLINVYKALPVAYPAIILEIQEDVVCVRSEATQILCASHEGYTYLQWETSPTLIKARVSDVDFITNQVFLTDFAYDAGYIGKRIQVRVKPNKTIVGLVYKTEEEDPVVCEIADLSLDGIGLNLMDNVYNPAVYSVGSKLTVHFRLPIEMDPDIQDRIVTMPYSPPLEKDYRLFHHIYVPSPLMNYPSIWGKITSMRDINSRGCTLQGIVMNNRSGANQCYRLGMQLITNRLAHPLLSKYIVQRQTEIIHEIRQTQDAIYRLVSNEKS